MTQRLSKCLLLASVAFIYTLIALNNVTPYPPGARGVRNHWPVQENRCVPRPLQMIVQQAEFSCVGPRPSLAGEGCRRVKFGAGDRVESLDLDGVQSFSFAPGLLTGNFVDLAI
jgi:hypothetical protein